MYEKQLLNLHFLSNFLNVLDLVSIAGYILGTVDYNEAQSIASDVNFDETTNILDMVSIVQYILGIITYDTLHANYIWRFFLEHVNGVIMGTQDSITPTNPTVGFKAFVRSGADARIYFIPSPDGEVLFDENQHQNILDALNSKDWNTIMTAIGSTPIQSMLEVLTPVSYNYQNQTIEDNEYPQGTIRTIKNTLTFNGNGNYNYLFAIAIIKNDDNSAEVKWKEYEILTWFFQIQILKTQQNLWTLFSIMDQVDLFLIATEVILQGLKFILKEV